MMNTDRVVKYAKRTLMGVAGVAAAAAIYIFALGSVTLISKKDAPKIHSKSHLEQILDGERERAGIDEAVEIEVRLTNNDWEYNHVKKVSEGKYKILLAPDGQNLSTLRHELYHIADGHCDDRARIENDFLNELDYFFRREPQAIIYALTGLKP